ncbi:MAG: hypothetical protein IT176_02210 [Acidobacteria bacterium]|nr:hypothetical protein [Acidobacteriota bacterium]
MLPRRAPAWAAAIVGLALTAFVAAAVGWKPSAAEALPARLSDAEFWSLIEEFSEPNGSFRSDNLLSNEVWMQTVIPDLTQVARRGRIYMGVGPEQNFTYIAALEPKMAFIVDVRRGNLDLHLMYKALFELSADRAEFVSRLFSRPRPDGLSNASSADDIFAAVGALEGSPALFDANLRAILDRYATHGQPLAPEDRAGLEYVYRAFFEFGPSIQYSSTSRYTSRGLFGGRGQPTYADLMTATDADSTPRSFLATEDRFAFVKTLESHNLLVPVVGNFAGPRALRAIGAYLKRRSAVVSAFYLSNVEQYLRQDGLWSSFCGNAAALPFDDSSVFIRSVRGGRTGARFGFGLNSQLGRMATDIGACAP